MKGKKIFNILPLMIVCFLGISLILFPDKTSQGAYNGIYTCIDIVVPSMFTFMFLIIFATESGYLFKIFKLPAKLISKIFKIDFNYCCIFITGMLGGYLSAAKSISILREKGAVSKENSSVLLCFCTNAGPSFLISAVGSKMFLSNKLGYILYAASVLSSFTLMAIYKGKLIHKVNKCEIECKPFPQSFIYSVKSACNFAVMISAFIIIFNSFMPLIKIKPLYLKSVIFGILEVVSGCKNISAFSSLTAFLTASALCSFGGICIFLQICSVLPQINTKRFFISRVLNALFTTLYTYLLIEIFRIKDLGTFITNNVAIDSIASSTLPLQSALLLLCCVAFPLCIAEKKK